MKLLDRESEGRSGCSTDKKRKEVQALAQAQYVAQEELASVLDKKNYNKALSVKKRKVLVLQSIHCRFSFSTPVFVFQNCKPQDRRRAYNLHSLSRPLYCSEAMSIVLLATPASTFDNSGQGNVNLCAWSVLYLPASAFFPSYIEGISVEPGLVGPVEQCSYNSILKPSKGLLFPNVRTAIA
ncbi:unnamed protein product [Dovyalis caffra]|uniref:Uncharacterized protein n=1 Tax=Dovyalis caffra TaxID=77055 RepID=A0AAV1QRH5_9ROSI|nr:unnamed protein product [Dovyalis caffra]